MDRELKETDNVSVEAIGEPGQRRFRLLTLIAGQTTIAWMEKQQLDVLGKALEQVLDTISDSQPASTTAASIGDFDESTRQQFRVGRIELGFDEDRNRIVLVVHDIEESSPDGPAALTALLTREQAHDLADSAAEVVAGGRPRCVLCGEPMGPGPHACVEQNGHMPDELSGVGIDEE